MIKANELRIGNKFLSIFGNEETVLSIIDNTSNGKIKIDPNGDNNMPHFKSQQHKDMYSHLILCEENGNQYKPCEIRGVPLKELHLIAFGLEGKSNQYYLLPSYDILINCSHSNHQFCIEITEHKHIELKYVHQLQNICFHLTDHELDIKIIK